MGLTRKNTGVPARSLVYSVLDFETTGLEPHGVSIVEIGIVKVTGTGQVLDEFATVVNTPGSTEEAQQVHGIDDQDLVGAPTWEQVWPEVNAFVQGTVLVAHNLDFEEKFLLAAARHLRIPLPPVPGLCTLQTARRQLDGRAYSLKSLHRSVSGQWRNDEHTALGDARASRDLLMWLLETAPSPLYLKGPSPVGPVGHPAPLCLTRSRPARTYTRSLAVLAGDFPASPRPRTGNAMAIAHYTAALREAMDDGRLTGKEISQVADAAMKTGVTGPQLLALHHDAWVGAWPHAHHIETADILTLRQMAHTAEQLGLEQQSQRCTQLLASTQHVDTATAAERSQHSTVLSHWRIGFAGDDPATAELRSYAVAHGARAAKNITKTVQLTVATPSALSTTMATSSLRLKIPVLPPSQAQTVIEQAVTEGIKERATAQAHADAEQAAWKKCRAEQDLYWRHHWRTKELRADPGPKFD